MNSKGVKIAAPASSASGCRGRAGFTLIEILVAMGILAIILLGLAASATSVMRANKTSYLSTVATTLAQDKLEALEAVSPSSLTPCSSDCDNPPKTANNVTFTRTWTITSTCNGVAGLKCITVTIAWTDYAPRTITASVAVAE